jgi:general secretion pathway protein H
MEKREEKARTLTSRTGISSNYYLHTRGFTLLEIIVVIFILSLSLAIVFPSINTKRTLNSEAKRLASILRYLLDNAITKKETLTLTVKFPERVLIYETSEGKREERFPALEGIQSSQDTIKEGSSITIFFYPTGVKDLFTFVLKNEKEEYLVKINPVSNRVKIENKP